GGLAAGLLQARRAALRQRLQSLDQLSLPLDRRRLVAAAGDANGTELLRQGAVCRIGSLRRTPVGEQPVIVGVQPQDALRQVLDLANASAEVSLAGTNARGHLRKRRSRRSVPRPLPREEGLFEQGAPIGGGPGPHPPG